MRGIPSLGGVWDWCFSTSYQANRLHIPRGGTGVGPVWGGFSWVVKRLVFLGLWRSRSSVVGGQGVSRRFSAVVAVAVLGAKARRPGSQEAGTAEPQKRKKTHLDGRRAG